MSIESPQCNNKNCQQYPGKTKEVWARKTVTAANTGTVGTGSAWTNHSAFAKQKRSKCLLTLDSQHRLSINPHRRAQHRYRHTPSDTRGVKVRRCSYWCVLLSGRSSALNFWVQKTWTCKGNNLDYRITIGQFTILIPILIDNFS